MANLKDSPSIVRYHYVCDITLYHKSVYWEYSVANKANGHIYEVRQSMVHLLGRYSLHHKLGKSQSVWQETFNCTKD